MNHPRVLILRAPGTNCDSESAFAFERAGAQTQRLHINRLLENPAAVDHFQVLCLPGGFSYGDDLGAGRILGNQIRVRLADCFRRFKDQGKLILGICNGFQILMKSGLLLDDIPGSDGHPVPPATLTWNDSGRFEDRWVQLEVRGNRCVFLSGIHSMYLPVAHAEGKLMVADPQVWDTLLRHDQLALRYRPLDTDQSASDEPLPFPDNPNGAQGNVAGVCDETGRVFGLMPHPERHIDPTHHPRWTRRLPLPEEGDGLQVFRNAVRYFQ